MEYRTVTEVGCDRAPCTTTARCLAPLRRPPDEPLAADALPRGWLQLHARPRSESVGAFSLILCPGCAALTTVTDGTATVLPEAEDS